MGEPAGTKEGEEIGLTEPISLRIPSSPEFVLLARLVVSHVGQLAGFGTEDVYDLKLAVTEAVTNVIRHAAVEAFEVEYRAKPGTVEVVVKDAGEGFGADDLTKIPGDEGQGGFGLAMIHGLMDDVTLDSTKDGGTLLRMVRHSPALEETG